LIRPLKPDRIPCCVIGCGRTASKEWAGNNTEIICGPHWRMVNKHLRSRYRRCWRLIKKARARNSEVALRYLYRVENEVWEKIKADANNVAVGIG